MVGHHAVGTHYRVILNITATDVVEPSHLVQGRDEEGGGSLEGREGGKEGGKEGGRMRVKKCTFCGEGGKEGGKEGGREDTPLSLDFPKLDGHVPTRVVHRGREGGREGEREGGHLATFSCSFLRRLSSLAGTS